MRSLHLFSAAVIAVFLAAGCDGGGTDTESGSSTGASGPGGAGGAGGATGGTGNGGMGDGGVGNGGTGGSGGATCPPPPACDAAAPAGEQADWRHFIESPIIVASGDPNHRGRDLFLNPGDPQWVIGKFSYGLIDKDLEDEDVDVYLLRDCAGAWELLGTATTTHDDQHATVEGVDDSGGRIYFQIPPGKELGPGRHRFHLVVKGDLSATDLFIEVVPPGAHVFVSDVDGTLTTTETAEFPALLQGALPDAHPYAAEAFQKLVDKGYRPLYLTARPEWLVQRTRDFLAAKGFPPGIVHTTLTLTGATGDPAGVYKTGELALLAQKGIVPAYGFGNTASDADAYENASIAPKSACVFYQFDDTAHGGRRIESYQELFPELDALPKTCP